MRDVLIKVYQFNELSEKAQQKAVNDELNSPWNITECLLDEFIDDKKQELYNLGFYNKKADYNNYYIISKTDIYLEDYSNKADIHFNCMNVSDFFENKKQLYLLMRYLRKYGYWLTVKDIYFYLADLELSFNIAHNSRIYFDINYNDFSKHDIEVLEIIIKYFDNFLYTFSVKFAKEYNDYYYELTSFDFIADYLQDNGYEFYSNGELYSE